MIYLDNTTDAQAVLIPRNGDTPAGDITLTARNTVDLTTPIAVGVLDLKTSQLYYNVSLVLPEGLPDGEYQYELTAGGETLASGLLGIGVQPRCTDPERVVEYKKDITYQQYE